MGLFVVLLTCLGPVAPWCGVRQTIISATVRYNHDRRDQLNEDWEILDLLDRSWQRRGEEEEGNSETGFTGFSDADLIAFVKRYRPRFARDPIVAELKSETSMVSSDNPTLLVCIYDAWVVFMVDESKLVFIASILVLFLAWIDSSGGF